MGPPQERRIYCEIVGASNTMRVIRYVSVWNFYKSIPWLCCSDHIASVATGWMIVATCLLHCANGRLD